MANINLTNLNNIYQKVKQRLFPEYAPKVKFDAAKFLSNVFRRQHAKNALVSYIVHPFIFNDHYFYHTNRIECHVLCEILDELGFNVDVADYDAQNVSLTKDYSIVVGFGQVIEDILHLNSKKDFKLLLYRSGTDALYSDTVSLKRLSDFYSIHQKLLLKSAPLYPYSLRAQVWFADVIIALGNSFVAETYLGKTMGKIESLDLMYFDVGVIDLDKKNFCKTKNNFLWFGSRGAIRKGLDLSIDYFKNHPQLNLYICGLNIEEEEFIDYYKDDLLLPNIFNLGFVEMESQKFKDLMMICGAVIFPTIWEGGGGAIINLLAVAGLIPIVPKNLGLDFEGREIVIEDFNDEAIAKAMSKYLLLSESEKLERAKFLLKFFREKHAIEKFRNSFRKIVVDNL